MKFLLMFDSSVTLNLIRYFHMWFLFSYIIFHLFVLIKCNGHLVTLSFYVCKIGRIRSSPADLSCRPSFEVYLLLSHVHSCRKSDESTYVIFQIFCIRLLSKRDAFRKKRLFVKSSVIIIGIFHFILFENIFAQDSN